MERRIFLAICLSILVMYVYQVYFLPPPREPDPAVTAPAETADAPPPAASEPVVSSGEPAADAVVAADTERRIVVSTSNADVELTNRGGRLLHYRLKEFLDNGEPLDLVPSSAPDETRKPFSLEVDDPGLTRRLNESLYRIAGDQPLRLDATTAPVTVTFEYEEAGGLRVRKTFRFEPDSYIVTFDADVANGAQTLNPTVHWGPGLGDTGAAQAGGSFFTGNYVQPPAGIFHRDGDVERLTGDAIGDMPVEGDFLFAGVNDHYFMAAAVETGPARLLYEPVTAASGDEEHRFVSFAARFEGGPRERRYFVGPKQIEALRDVNPEMVYAIHFGIFHIIVVPLLQSLTWLYGVIGNYGWAIIVLTILINLVMFPLRHKSLVSMRKLQLIQPQVKAIQERYANLKITDPARQKMNTEIMNLYREKGANPAAGCVPMLLTMPVLLAFYSMLSQSIELRGADFGFWIHDLSQKDPYYVTPLLMGGTMFWQQWMVPTSADPMQQRMMLVMPVVFTGLFLGFPSGLAIYYLVSNLFQIGQQYFTKRTIGPPPGAPARPAAERRLKKAVPKESS